jgi:hypothetical protein
MLIELSGYSMTLQESPLYPTTTEQIPEKPNISPLFNFFPEKFKIKKLKKIKSFPIKFPGIFPKTR